VVEPGVAGGALPAPGGLVEGLVREGVGPLVPLSGDVLDLHGTEGPGPTPEVVEEGSEVGALDPVLARHLPGHELAVGQDEK